MTAESIAVIVSIVSLCSAVTSIFFAFRNGKHTDIKDVEARVADATKLEVKIDNLLVLVADIKDEVKNQRNSITDITVRLAAVEVSAKQAHKRLDEIKR